MYRSVWGVVLAIALTPVFACDKGGGDSGGEPENITMTSFTLANETATSSWSFTIEAPEQVTPDLYMNVAHDLFADNWFKVRVTPRDDRDLAQVRSHLDEMNIDGYELIVDEPNALLVRIDSAGDRHEFEVYYKVQLGDMAVRCESVGPVGDPFTQAQAERMLEACRSLALGGD